MISPIAYPDPFHALLALGLTDEDSHCAVRLSLSVYTTDEDIDYALTAIGETLHDTLSSIRSVAWW